jgi:hypothetical protein
MLLDHEREVVAGVAISPLGSECDLEVALLPIGVSEAVISYDHLLQGWFIRAAAAHWRRSRARRRGSRVGGEAQRRARAVVEPHAHLPCTAALQFAWRNVVDETLPQLAQGLRAPRRSACTLHPARAVGTVGAGFAAASTAAPVRVARAQARALVAAAGLFRAAFRHDAFAGESESAGSIATYPA